MSKNVESLDLVKFLYYLFILYTTIRNLRKGQCHKAICSSLGNEDDA